VTGRDLSRFYRHVRRRLSDILPDFSRDRFRERVRENRRYLKRLLLLAGLLLLLIPAWMVMPRIIQRAKGWQARRLASQVMVLIEHKDWAGADRKLRDAISLRPDSPQVCLATARLLSRTGQKAEAMDWWHRVGHLAILTARDHRDYAATALAASDLDDANQEVQWLMSQGSAALPQDILLAGELALARGLSESAIRYAEKAFTDSRATTQDLVNGAGLIFRNRTSDDLSRSQACHRLLALARDPTDPAALDALTLLAEQTSISNKPTTTQAGLDHGGCGGEVSLSEIAERLDTHPKARGLHHVLACDLKARLDPSHADEIVAEAVRSLGHGDDETLIVLGQWLYSRNRFQTELEVLTPARAAKRRELFLERADALTAIGRTAEAEELLSSESSLVDPASQHMRLAVMKSRAGEAVGADNEWEWALESAGTAQQLLILASYAERNGAPAVADIAYDRLAIKQSNLRSAYIAHLRLAESLDETAKAHEIALKITQRWPNDASSRMHEIYLRLLLGTSDSETKHAEDSAKGVLAQNPWHFGARMVLALARLKMGKSAGALEAVSGENFNQAGNAPPMAVRAAALTANGWNEMAQEEVQKLTALKLLPEERALISAIVHSR
jgi:Tfp pilus assembly protein PilF